MASPSMIIMKRRREFVSLKERRALREERSANKGSGLSLKKKRKHQHRRRNRNKEL